MSSRYGYVERLEKFYDLLNEYQVRAGIPTAQLAQITGMDNAFLDWVFKGIIAPPEPSTITRIANALNVSTKEKKVLLQPARL